VGGFHGRLPHRLRNAITLVFTIYSLINTTTAIAPRRRCGGVTTQLILGCGWYALLLARTVITQFALCEAWIGALDVTGRRLIAMAGRLVVEVGWRCRCLEDCWECCSSLSSLDGACCSVKHDEARDLGGSHLSFRQPAPIAGYIATYRTCYVSTRTALLGLFMLTGPRHLRNWINWTDLLRLLNCLEADPSVNTARNNTRIVAIVGYHGNAVYRAVTWIPICVSVT
jgi:hypothetical protein